MRMQRRLARLREAFRDPDEPLRRWAVWVIVGYAEPFGTPRFAVWARFWHGDSKIIGRGTTIRKAVKDAEREVAKHNPFVPERATKENT